MLFGQAHKGHSKLTIGLCAWSVADRYHLLSVEIRDVRETEIGQFENNVRGCH